MREWYTTNELLTIDGMPNSQTGIGQKARRNNWIKRKALGQGRTIEYHISSFHPEIKKQLIEKFVTDQDEAMRLIDLTEPTEALPVRSNITKMMPATEFKEWSELPVYNVHAAAGAGTLVGSEFQIETLRIPTNLLAEFGLSESCSSIIYVDGDSMEPTLSNNDRLLVDTREQQHPVANGVYVIRIDDAVYVKRLRWDIYHSVYNVISDNTEYPVFQIDHTNGRNFKIIGKAIAPLFKKIF